MPLLSSRCDVLATAGVEHYPQPGPSSWLALTPSDCPKPHSLLLRVCQNLCVQRGGSQPKHLAVTWMQEKLEVRFLRQHLLSYRKAELGICLFCMHWDVAVIARERISRRFLVPDPWPGAQLATKARQSKSVSSGRHLGARQEENCGDGAHWPRFWAVS